MPEDHLLRAGCIIGGLIERDLVSKADLIITIGLDAVELQPKGWPYTTKVLSFANHPSLDALVACNEEVIGARPAFNGNYGKFTARIWLGV